MSQPFPGCIHCSATDWNVEMIDGGDEKILCVPDKTPLQQVRSLQAAPHQLSGIFFGLQKFGQKITEFAAGRC